MATGKYHEWLTDDGLLKLTAWARNGLIDKQIAHNIGISVKTLYEWKNSYSDIRDALKNGKEVVDIMVENALFRRAVGYKYTEITKERRNGELEVTKEIVKEVSPDTTAQIFWLKNRLPGMWRDRKEMLNENKDVTVEEFLRKLADENAESN